MATAVRIASEGIHKGNDPMGVDVQVARTTYQPVGDVRTEIATGIHNASHIEQKILTLSTATTTIACRYLPLC